MTGDIFEIDLQSKKQFMCEKNKIRREDFLTTVDGGEMEGDVWWQPKTVYIF